MKTLEISSRTMGRDGRGQPGHVGYYSALIPSFLIRGTTSFSSLSSMAASSCGVLDFVSAGEVGELLDRRWDRCSVVTMAALSLARISGGSLAGANRPV